MLMPRGTDAVMVMAISPDDRHLFLFRTSKDGDIWIANLK
jgi:hypothetical protein